MKTSLKALALILGLSTGTSALATVDGNDRFFMVVENINTWEPKEYFVERAPVIGCYGVEQGPRLEAWASEYLAPASIGCGMDTGHANINALNCASVIDSKERDDYMGFKEVTLDISKCEDKNNPNFIKAIKETAKLNFPQKNSSQSVVLKLIK